MINSTCTDHEILTALQSRAPEHIVRGAWNALISKYQDELEEYALELWSGDDFLVSDTLDRALITARMWIKAQDEIDLFSGDLRQWLRSTLRQQFYRDSGKDRFGRSCLEMDDDCIDGEWTVLETERYTTNSLHHDMNVDDQVV